MTRDNLKLRNLNKPVECIFCAEEQTVSSSPFLFQCIVAKQIWQTISQIFDVEVGNDYLSVAKFWLANKKHASLNSICVASLWCL
jgi:hypothetical protein